MVQLDTQELFGHLLLLRVRNRDDFDGLVSMNELPSRITLSSGVIL
jgi:hypothetical protein